MGPAFATLGGAVREQGGENATGNSYCIQKGLARMSTGSGIMLAVGGAALVLGVAYGVNTVSYRDAELEVMAARVAQVEARNDVLEGRASEAGDLAARVAELEAQLTMALAAPEAAEAAPVAEDTAVAASASFGDAQAGVQVFRKCQSCHAVGADAKDRVGPHLNGIFGRRAGLHDGFNYSDDMAMMGADGLTWTLEMLDAYLENPKALVSRTRMNFAGLKDTQDRADVLTFLRQYSDNPANIPEAVPTAMAPEVTLSPEILAIVGDPEYGEYLASECETCHQRSGADDGIPSITQWPEDDFVIAMHAYKQKIRPHPVMQMMAGRLSDEEIAALAAYFGDLD